jgi:hypothetical protein
VALPDLVALDDVLAVDFLAGLGVFLLSWLKRTFSLSLVAGKRAMGSRRATKRSLPVRARSGHDAYS